MRVVSIDARRLKHALHDEVVPRPSDVVHDFFATFLLNGFADSRSKCRQHFIPGSARPRAAAARPHPLHGIEHAVRIVNLIDRRWPLSAEASSACWMLRVTFKFLDLLCLLIDVGQQAAS